MTYRLPALSALRAFESAARHLSFKNAAAELCVTPAAVSQQIKSLESYLGVALFRRLPRALELTGQGAAMVPKVSEAFACLVAAVEATRPADGGLLTVHAPPSLALRWLVPRLSRFAAAHPEVALRLASDVGNIDGVGSGPVGPAADLRDAGSEVAIRFGEGHYAGFSCELILAPDYVLVCSPELLARIGPLCSPVDIGDQVLIHDESIPDAEKRPNWQEWFRLAGVPGKVDAGGPRFSSAALVLEAALDGQGMALTLRPLVEADVASGRLVMPFDTSLPSRYAYYLVIPEAIAARPAVQAFRGWLLREVGVTMSAAAVKSPGDIIAP